MRSWALALAGALILVGCEAIKPQVDETTWWAIKIAGFVGSVGVIWAAVVKVRHRLMKARNDAIEKHRLAGELHIMGLQADNERKTGETNRTELLRKIEAAVLGDGEGTIGARFNTQNEMLTEIKNQRNPESIAALGLRVDAHERRISFTSAKVRLIIENDPKPTAFLKENGDMTHANKAFRDLFTHCAPDLTGSSWQTCVVDRSYDSVVRSFTAAIKSGRNFKRVFNICPNGHGEKEIEMTMHPKMDDDTEKVVVGWVVTIDVHKAPK